MAQFTKPKSQKKAEERRKGKGAKSSDNAPPPAEEVQGSAPAASSQEGAPPPAETKVDAKAEGASTDGATGTVAKPVDNEAAPPPAETKVDAKAEGVAKSDQQPKQKEERPRHFTMPKPRGGVWDDLETALWDIGVSPNARPQMYQTGKDDNDKKPGAGAKITFKLTPEQRIKGEAVDRIFGSGGELRDAPAAIKRLARRVPAVWLVDEYYVDFDGSKQIDWVTIWLQTIAMSGFLPNRLSRGIRRRRPLPIQQQHKEDGSLMNRCFVWSQTITPKQGTLQLTGWVVMGIGDLDYTHREYSDGGIIIFKPLNVEISKKKRKLSIVQILTTLIFSTPWFFGILLAYMKSVNPQNFTDDRMGKADDEADDEEVTKWATERNQRSPRPIHVRTEQGSGSSSQ